MEVKQVMETAPEEGSTLRGRLIARLNDYAELTKARVTSLIIVTAACGFFFGARRAGIPVLSWTLLHALVGIGMVSSGTAALNEVMEHDVDARMRRTARRPIPAGRMSPLHAGLIGAFLALGGSIYLVFLTNLLTGVLTLLTSVVYLAAYTPLKKISPICTFVGAFPGAMPGVLGWTAASDRLEWGTLALFTILFLWQFPHFFAIAWMYREDYARGAIRMLPVVEPEGRSTSRRILIYSLALLPVSFVPAMIGMAGHLYFYGALILGSGFIYYAARLAILKLPVADIQSRLYARRVFRCSILYLPLLLLFMMCNAVR
jgi:heme o synthase